MKKVKSAFYLRIVSMLTIFFYSIQFCTAQDAEAVMKKYQEAISNIQLLSYEINRIDTFASGGVWNNNGYCHLRREPGDKMFGFSFVGKRKDIPDQAWYDGQYFFSINHEKKSYGINRTPSPGVLGSPGGQMVSPEFIRADTGYTALSVSGTADQYILRLQFPDIREHDISNHNKFLYLDKKTYLPQKIISYNDALDKKNVQVRTFSKILVNDRSSEQQLANKELLTSYTQLVRSTKNELEVLIGKEAPAFALQSFAGQPVNLQDLRGKMVLLDFWEVWCGPCIQSMPKVQAMHEKYGEKGLVVLGVTLDKNNLSSNKLFAEKKKFTFTNTLGNEQTEKSYKVNAIPEYILIDKTGKIILAQAGFSEEIEKMIKEKLGG